MGTVYCKEIKLLLKNKAHNSQKINKKLREADESYAQAVKSDPNEMKYLLNRAHILFDLESWNELEKALKILENGQLNADASATREHTHHVVVYKSFVLNLNDLRSFYQKKREYLNQLRKSMTKKL